MYKAHSEDRGAVDVMGTLLVHRQRPICENPRNLIEKEVGERLRILTCFEKNYYIHLLSE